jgi:tRNA 2-thiouridine synthesizing protein A
MTEEPAKVLDVKGLYCPMPIVKLSVAIKEVPVGGIIKVIATEEAFPPDVESWCRNTGNELLSSTESEGEFTVTIRRKK